MSRPKKEIIEINSGLKFTRKQLFMLLDAVQFEHARQNFQYYKLLFAPIADSAKNSMNKKRSDLGVIVNILEKYLSIQKPVLQETVGPDGKITGT